MLDIERIRDKLDELQRYLEEVEEDLPQTKKGYLNNRTIRRACERTFQLASENLLDVCNIIISEKRLPVPKDNKDSILKLEEAGIYPKGAICQAAGDGRLQEPSGAQIWQGG